MLYRQKSVVNTIRSKHQNDTGESERKQKRMKLQQVTRLVQPLLLLELLAVNFDPVTAYSGLDLLAVPVKDNEVRLLRGHVAIDTVAGGAMIFGKPWGLRLMAAETDLPKLSHIVLRDMYIVTGEAGHA